MRQVFLVALLSVLSISASGQKAGILEQFAGGACTHDLEQRNSGPAAKGQGDAVEDHTRPRRQREEEETQEQEPRSRGDRRGGVVVDPQTGKAYPRVGNGVVDPSTGKFYPRSGPGYIDPATGRFIPAN
jgi:hypothetical protein